MQKYEEGNSADGVPALSRWLARKESREQIYFGEPPVLES
jgi:hypothetical protein